MITEILTDRPPGASMPYVVVRDPAFPGVTLREQCRELDEHPYEAARERVLARLGAMRKAAVEHVLSSHDSV